MNSGEDMSGPWGQIRGKPGRRPPVRRRTRPALEVLEGRLTPSGGGWISSLQSGQSGDGLLGQYYNNPSLSGTPSFTRWDNLIDFSASGSNSYPGGAPGPGFGAVGPGGWSAKWTGLLTATLDESYNFSIDSTGDGVRLWVTLIGQQQGSPLIVDWTGHGQLNDTATLTLQAGRDYAVEMDATQASSISQQLSLKWSSSSTPLADIEPVTLVGLNVDGNDGLFANLVNGGTRSSWFPENGSPTVPTDSNAWPENDATILLAEGDSSQDPGGSYLVQFNGEATVNYNFGSTDADWLVNGVDLHSQTLQAGEGYDPATNTTTATMVIQPNTTTVMYVVFTHTCRNPYSVSEITSISEVGTAVTVSLPSVAGIVPDQTTTISGLAGDSAGYNGSFLITGVNQQDKSFTFTDTNTDLPSGLSAGSASFAGNGITKLYIMQPSTQGGSAPLPIGTLFTPATLSMAAEFTTLRFMGLEATNDNLTSNWSDRALVSSNFWSSQGFNSGAGVDTGVAVALQASGLPWEIQVALANETGKDIYINIPSNASIEYIDNLANLFAYGSDGVTPYTSVQAEPIWKPLDSNLKVYIEFSNETWNYGFPQAETRGDGWINQLSQRALYDFLTGDHNDPLYPGGGGSAYDDGSILASSEAVNSLNDGTFLASYNSDPDPSTDGASPLYFANTDPTINGYSLGQNWVGLRDVQTSDAFKATFGETDIAAADVDSRVRPVYEWQGGGGWSAGLAFIDSTYGAVHPVNYYLYGGGGNWYAGNTSGGFSEVSFVDPAFTGGLDGWLSSGSAGVVSNESPMGNPEAPPAFSAIEVTGGASESGNLVTITTTSPHDFRPGESINVSGVTLTGYDGTFTVESANPDNLTYYDSNSGLSDSGDGVVTGNASSGLAAYLQPGGDISQEVTFSGGYADITLYACQTVAPDWYHGLAVILTPTDGGPDINGGQPINWSQGEPSYDGSQNAFSWDCSEAFYTGDKSYTYAITFTSTLPSGTVFLAAPAIQTVNGMFDETTAALRSTTLDINGQIQSDVDIALDNGLSEVGYEGGYLFDQNLSYNSYATIGSAGYSSNVPNIAMYANLDPRTEQLAVDTLDEFYSAGGSLPIMFESSRNINSWAMATPYYFDLDTPKFQAAVSVEQTPQPATYGFTPGHVVTGSPYWQLWGYQVNSSWLVPSGSYAITVSFDAGTEWAVGQTDPVKILINGRLLVTEEVPVATGGTFTIPVSTLSTGQYSVELFNAAPVGYGDVNLGIGNTPVYSLFEVAMAAPTLVVADAGGVYDGSSFPASVSVAGVGGVAGASLEGIAPVLTYYAGSAVAGTSLTGPPTTAGSYTVTAFFSGSADYVPATTQATFTIGRILVAAAGGASQSALVNGTFATPLEAKVVDQYGNPVSGVPVTFAAPANGASGTFVGGETVTATTNALGLATAPAFTANTSVGAYTVSAIVSGVSPVTYSLTNNENTSTTLTIQSALVPIDVAETFTATVAAVAPAVSRPIGSVNFYEGSKLLGSAMINSSGQAVLTTSTLAFGAHSITATYNGNTSGYLTSGSGSVPMRVGDTVSGDYDGDGKSDIAIYDQTNATFYIGYSGGGNRTQPLGNPADKNIPLDGDYDGDGRTDIAIYDQTLAEFFILDSNGGSLALPFGNPAHVNIPVVGDFDGSGKTDIAIYDQTAAIFYILESNGASVVEPFGNSKHVNIPLAGDYDGDGKTDIAIFDQTAATFYIVESGGGTIVKPIGNPSHVNVPIAADFDGDGKTDIAVYDQTAGIIYALESGGGTIAQSFGNPADVNVPLTSDFTGDGRTDIAIYDATDSDFFIIYSDGGSLALQFGNNKHSNNPANP